jgi:acyl carrier protein
MRRLSTVLAGQKTLTRQAPPNINSNGNNISFMGLDLVEIVMGWEAAFGISLSEAEANTMLTPRMAVDVIAAKLGAADGPSGPCITLRVFNRLRRAFVDKTVVAREKIRLQARLTNLLPEDNRKDSWQTVRDAAGLGFLPELRFGVGTLFKPITVADLFEIVPLHLKELKPPGEPWTRAEVRNTVRAIIHQQLKIRDFSDDDTFVRDLKLD